MTTNNPGWNLTDVGRRPDSLQTQGSSYSLLMGVHPGAILEFYVFCELEMLLEFLIGAFGGSAIFPSLLENSLP